MNQISIKQAWLVLYIAQMSGQAALTTIGTTAHLKVPLLQHFLNMAANDLEVAWFQQQKSTQHWDRRSDFYLCARWSRRAADTEMDI